VRATKARHVRAGEAPLDAAKVRTPAYVGAARAATAAHVGTATAHMGAAAARAAAARVLRVRQGRRSPDSDPEQHGCRDSNPKARSCGVHGPLHLRPAPHQGFPVVIIRRRAGVRVQGYVY
jgi:hypothetical protein